MKIDLKELDEWLLNNFNYTQEDRELIIQAVNEYSEEFPEEKVDEWTLRYCQFCGKEIDVKGIGYFIEYDGKITCKECHEDERKII